MPNIPTVSSSSYDSQRQGRTIEVQTPAIEDSVDNWIPLTGGGCSKTLRDIEMERGSLFSEIPRYVTRDISAFVFFFLFISLIFYYFLKYN